MSAVDRRLTLDESALIKEVKSDSPLFLDELQECHIRKDDAFMLEFNGATSDRKSLAKGAGFVRHPVQLVELDSVELTENKYMIDVVGYIANVGRSIRQRTGSRTLDFYLANERSSTQIFDDPNILALKELGSEIRPNRLCQWTLVSQGRALLKTSCCGRATVKMKTQNGWNFPTCGGENCKKGVGRKLGGWLCDACEKAVEYPVLRYMLKLGIFDATAHVVVVMFDETAYELVKCSADSLAQSNDEYLDDTSGLPAALVNIIGTTHTLELKSHTYYEHGTFKRFTCWNLIPPEEAVATSLKATEGKTPISLELEDSDADSLPIQVGRKKNQRDYISNEKDIRIRWNKKTV
uniref:Replication factor A C-terminal domain-containing protein n=1 Tax=Tanacetum cinerariifolium TaxID=118510 RepID=A0A6L2KLE7_TANCI|nr:hypothetical protein [Tanacetum cinerariifolium]